ncbi:MAG: peptidylprolyl isomerase [candidate division NC10 bacterium]|nr:peptidylprolyl isomerase [candidate division NC10 bacterium]
MGATLLLVLAGRIGLAAEAPSPAEPEANRILARVNQVEITYGEFKRRLDSLQQERGPIPRERYGEVLRGMVQEEILLQGTKAERLDQDAGVQARLEQARRQVLISELLRRKVIEASRVTDEEARKMYEDNKAVFSTDTVVASHILVKSQAEAEAILQEVKGGKDFAEVAKAKSQDTGSAEKGGDLGTLRRGQTVPEFEEEAFRLKEGELSGVVKTEYGYHILKGGAHTTATQPFEEVKDRIQKMLLQQKQQEIFMAFMAALEKRATSEVFEDRLK